MTGAQIVLDELIRAEKRKRVRRILCAAAAASLLCGWALSRFVLGVAQVRGASMEPTLADGTYIIYLRHPGAVSAGDIVIAAAKSGKEVIKRAAALPGGTVELRGGLLLINGRQEPNTPPALNSVKYPLQLGRDEYFLLGDNRENSLDSRDASFGTVTRENITGKLLFALRWGEGSIGR